MDKERMKEKGVRRIKAEEKECKGSSRNHIITRRKKWPKKKCADGNGKVLEGMKRQERECEGNKTRKKS